MKRSMKIPAALPAKADADLATVRRGRILDAAESLFAQNGVRGVTMEAAADAARVAKATLYSYFRNKDALFEGVARRIAETLADDFADALDQAGETPVRVRAALTAKHREVFRVVRGSAHARELFSAKDRLAREIFAEADRRMIDALAAALAADAAFASRAASLARALFFGAMGLADHCPDAERLEAEVAGFVDTHLAGARLQTPGAAS